MIENKELDDWLFTSPKTTSLGDLVYKSKQLSGLDILDKNKSSIKNMTDYHHKIMNVFLQKVHNSLYDKKNFYKRSDMFQDEIYFKITYRQLVDKMGLGIETRTTKDVRYLESQVEALSGIFMKIRDNSTIDSFPIFSNILIDTKEEELYFAFNKEILKSIADNNRKIDGEMGSKSSYITLNITDLNSRNLSKSALMLYEFFLSNKINVTINTKRYSIDEVGEYISNRTNSKPSKILEMVIIPAITELENELGFRIFYMCETYIKRNKLKNITFKVFLGDKYEHYENSKSDDSNIDFIPFQDINNPNLFNSSIREYKYCWDNKLTNYNYKDISEELFGEIVEWEDDITIRNNIISEIIRTHLNSDNKDDFIIKFINNVDYIKYCNIMKKLNLDAISEDKFVMGYRY